MPYTSITAARDAILTMFKTGWDAQGGTIPLVVYDDAVESIPKNAAPWVRIQVKHGPSNQATLGGVGNRRFRKTGIVTVQVFTESSGGLTLSDAYAKIAVDIFEGNTTTPDGVMFTNVTAKEIGNVGDWFQTNVTASFNYDIVK